MPKLSKPQNEVVDMFYRWQHCKVVRFADISTKTERFLIEFWNIDGQAKRLKFPNARTVRTLIKWGILVQAPATNTYQLSPEWEPKKEPHAPQL